MQPEYYIIIDRQQYGPFSKEALKEHNVTADSLVWRAGLPDWVKASALPELADVIAVDTVFEDLGSSENSRWFAMINGNQVGPYTIETLISMGLKPSTPVWRNGMADWMEASTQPEIMRHFTSTPPPHGFEQPRRDFADNPQYGSNNGFGGYRQQGGYTNYGYNSYQNRQPGNGYNNGMPRNNLHTNWLPWAIVATIVSLLFSCIGMIFGIIAIVNANKANDYYAAGFDDMGDQTNNTAKIMTIIAYVLAGIGLAFSGFFFSNIWTGFL